MTAIVWIHGFPLSPAMFTKQLTIGGYQHVAPDLRDPALTSMSDYSRAVQRFLDDEKIDQAVFAGFSMGGYITMQLLRDIPQRFKAMILIDTRETPDTDEGRAIRYKQIDDVRSSGSTESVVDAMLPKMVHHDSQRPSVREIMASASPEWVISALTAMATRPDSAETLRNANIPALVFVGDRDTITPSSDAERMVAMMKDAELAPIAGAAHMANYERPDQVNHIIEAWLDRKL
jgi:pimeloyl-ACP methyl ester carboxylesterase